MSPNPPTIHPFGLVPDKWLAPVAGIHLVTCGRFARGQRRIDIFAARHFGEYASSFAPWVDAWGLERVLAYLDQHDREKAAFLRANADRIHDVEADRAVAESKLKSSRANASAARRERRNRVQPKNATTRKVLCKAAADARAAVIWARRNAALAVQPVGLVPDKYVAAASGETRDGVEQYRARNGIAPMAHARWFSLRPGTFQPLIAAWGVDRARAWVGAHMAAAVRAFERDAKGAAKALTITSAALDGQPVGLVPDSAFASFGIGKRAVEGYRTRKGIVSQCGSSARRRFAAFVAAWGKETARQWLEEHAPQHLAAFDVDTTPKPKLVAVPKPAREVVPAPLTESEQRRRPPSPMPQEKPEPVRAHSVAEWIAAGGVVKKAPPMGWGDPDSPNYDPALVAKRRAEERKKGWRR